MLNKYNLKFAAINREKIYKKRKTNSGGTVIWMDATGL